MDVDADVIVGRERRRPRMDPHPDPEGKTAEPRVSRKSALRVRGRSHGVLRATEGDEERVALGPDLDAAVLLDGGAYQPMMLLERLGVSVAELLQEPRRPLDIGEEEGDRSGRELGDHLGP